MTHGTLVVSLPRLDQPICDRPDIPYLSNSQDEASDIRNTRYRTCQICGKRFLPEDPDKYVYRLNIPAALREQWHADRGEKNKGAWFCRYNCWIQAQRMVEAVTPKDEYGEPMKQTHKRRVEFRKVCQECGQEFANRASNALYCSRACAYTAKKRREHERAVRRWEARQHD